MKPEQLRSPTDLRSDFDLIARLSRDVPDALSPCERWLLAHAPARINEALDVGCGSGAFARALAGRSRHVLGIDLSPGMVELARQRSCHLANLEFAIQDASISELPEGRFDCVVSIAMLHHVSIRPMLLRLRAAVAPGGVLLVQDLDDSTGLATSPGMRLPGR
jgi:2-polyprenyl-3-methyl-5-hydroxy-6-metoxy-1,4-benzoquinol methylase